MGPNAGNKILALCGVAIAVLMLLAAPIIFGTGIFAPIGSTYTEVDFDATATAFYETEMERVYTAVSDMWQGHCDYLLNNPTTQVDENGYVVIDVFQYQCLGKLTEAEVQSIFDKWVSDAGGGKLKLTSLDPYKVGFDGDYVTAEKQWVVINRGEPNENWQKTYLLPETFVLSGVSKVILVGCDSTVLAVNAGELVIYDCHNLEEK